MPMNDMQRQAQQKTVSHGAVVAREYGIPAVVGVQGATERLATGQRITVDGSSGVITIEPGEHTS